MFSITPTPTTPNLQEHRQAAAGILQRHFWGVVDITTPGPLERPGPGLIAGHHRARRQVDDEHIALPHST